MMLTECADTCSVGEVVCADTHPDCINWAGEGRCSSDAKFMKSTCAASCGICTRIALLYDGYQGKKDEL